MPPESPPESPNEPCHSRYDPSSVRHLKPSEAAITRRPNEALELEGYEGIRIRRDDGGYLQPVKGLIERFDPEMREAGDDP